MTTLTPVLSENENDTDFGCCQECDRPATWTIHPMFAPFDPEPFCDRHGPSISSVCDTCDT